MTKWTCTIVGFTRTGGFEAELLHEGHGNMIFVRAVKWRGSKQPRIVLHPGNDGYEFWHKQMTPIRKELKFQGSGKIQSDLETQWLASM